MHVLLALCKRNGQEPDGWWENNNLAVSDENMYT